MEFYGRPDVPSMSESEVSDILCQLRNGMISVDGKKKKTEKIL